MSNVFPLGVTISQLRIAKLMSQARFFVGSLVLGVVSLIGSCAINRNDSAMSQQIDNSSEWDALKEISRENYLLRGLPPTSKGRASAIAENTRREERLRQEIARKYHKYDGPLGAFSFLIIGLLLVALPLGKFLSFLDPPKK